MAARVPPTLKRLRCPRCERLNIRREGNARSSLDWFTCLSCSHVWSSAAKPVHANFDGGASSKHVLIVDDDDAIVALVTAHLDEYKVTACIDPNDALQALERDHIDLLIVDFLMPAMSGDELIERARTVQPSLPIVVITGYASAANNVGLSDVRILEKPFTRAELLENIALAHASRLDS
jgi:CheY-like chemotaxis protein